MLSEALADLLGRARQRGRRPTQGGSDLGVPVVGVGLLYQQGYFRQVDRQGRGAAGPVSLQRSGATADHAAAPAERGVAAAGDRRSPGYSVWLRAWQVQVGRVRLYLLDSNDPANFPSHRGITSELYGGGPELRLQQELLLGIGGWRLLERARHRARSLPSERGHAAFAVLERARRFMQADRAAVRCRAGGHAGGQPVHDPYRGGRRLRPLRTCAHRAVPRRATPSSNSASRSTTCWPWAATNRTIRREPFNMAYLAIRGSGAVNGVSRLHGQVSRQLFEPLFPRWPEDEVPVGHVTNGVHVPTWDSAAADELWTEACGKDRWLGTTETLERDIRRVTDASLWQFRTAARRSLVEYARARLSRQLAASGAHAGGGRRGDAAVRPRRADPGFRAPLRDVQAAEPAAARPRAAAAHPRAIRERPVQLILAGKAHPADRAGQALIREWTRLHPAAGGAAARDLPRRLRHAADRATGAGRRCLAQHPAAALGGQRNERHEGARQWRAQRVGAGWLVGGGLRARCRAGPWATARSTATIPPGMPRRPSALYDLLEREVDPRVLLPRRQRHSHGLGRAHAGEHGPADAAVLRQPRGARVHRAATTCRPRRPTGSARPTTAPWAPDRGVAARAGATVERAAIRRTAGSKPAATGITPSRSRSPSNELEPQAVQRRALCRWHGGADAPVRQEMQRAGSLPGRSVATVYAREVPSTRPAGDYTPRAIPRHARCGRPAGSGARPVAAMSPERSAGVRCASPAASMPPTRTSNRPSPATRNHGTGRRRQFRDLQPPRHAGSPGTLRRVPRTPCRPRPSTSIPTRQPDGRRLARLGGGHPARPALRLPDRRARIDPASGHRFNPNKLLLDPYRHRDRAAARVGLRGRRAATTPRRRSPICVPSPDDDAGATPKCVFTHDVLSTGTAIRPLRHPWSTPSSTSCMCAASRSIRAAASSIPAPIAA